jgi:hypothetical protein
MSIRFTRSLILVLPLLICIQVSASVQKLTVDSGECDESAVSAELAKSPVFVDAKRYFRAYGSIESQPSKADKGHLHCHVIYTLFISTRGKGFSEVKRFAWDAEPGQITGIDMIGLSPNGAKFAADFWWAEGDGEVHRPVIVDLASRAVVDRSVEDSIQKRIHSCDQNEDFVGVTNSGEALFAIPPSTYDDSPECGDKGVWSFNAATGEVRQVAKHTEDRWR